VIVAQRERPTWAISSSGSPVGGEKIGVVVVPLSNKDRIPVTSPTLAKLPGLGRWNPFEVSKDRVRIPEPEHHAGAELGFALFEALTAALG
jgi:hypothetical protein